MNRMTRSQRCAHEVAGLITTKCSTDTRTVVGAEIGVFRCGTARHVLETIPNILWLMIDPWKNYAEYSAEGTSVSRQSQDTFDMLAVKAAEIVNRDCPGRGVVMRMTSMEASEIIADGSLDFVFIDGNHTAKYVRQDLRAWWPKVRSGGVFSGHDYAHKYPGLRKEVDQWSDEMGVELTFCEHDTSLFWTQV